MAFLSAVKTSCFSKGQRSGRPRLDPLGKQCVILRGSGTRGLGPAAPLPASRGGSWGPASSPSPSAPCGALQRAAKVSLLWASISQGGRSPCILSSSCSDKSCANVPATGLKSEAPCDIQRLPPRAMSCQCCVPWAWTTLRPPHPPTSSPCPDRSPHSHLASSRLPSTPGKLLPPGLCTCMCSARGLP